MYMSNDRYIQKDGIDWLFMLINTTNVHNHYYSVYLVHCWKTRGLLYDMTLLNEKNKIGTEYQLPNIILVFVIITIFYGIL